MTEVYTGQATPKSTRVKNMHPAMVAAQQFREDVKKDMEPPVTQQLQQPVVQQPITQQPVVQQPVVQQPQTEVQYTPVTNIPIPAGYVDFLSSTPEPIQQATAPINTFEEDNKKLLAELAESRKELEELKNKAQIPDELRAIQEERNIETLLQQAGLEFSSINTEDAKKLLAPIMSTLRKQTSDLEEAFKKRLENQQATVDSVVNTLNEKQKQTQNEATRKKILEAHPDLETIQKSEAYHRAMLSSVQGRSDLLVGQLVAAEFQRGNADYVIDVINSIKGSQPNLDSIASVSASGMSTMPAPSSTDSSDGILTDDQIADMKYDMQRGILSKADFGAAMKKHREAASKDYSHKSN